MINNDDIDQIMVAQNTLQSGGVLLYPTETIFGLGCDALQYDAVQKVREMKSRPDNKSFLVLCSSLDQVRKDFELTQAEDEFLSKLWPAPCTVVLRPKHHKLKDLCSESGGLGVRWSSHPLLTKLFEKWDGYLLSTSANLSGESYSDTQGHLESIFKDKVDMIIGLEEHYELMGQRDVVLPSSVIQLEPKFQVFRSGAIDSNELKHHWHNTIS